MDKYIKEPTAICTVDGLPNKGVQSTVYKIFQNRYKICAKQSFVTTIPRTGHRCMIADCMNMIHLSPIGVNTFKDYAYLLLSNCVLPLLKRGYEDGWVLFDQCGTQGLSPKVLGQQRRDKGNEGEDDVYNEICDSTLLPPHWRDVLKNRMQQAPTRQLPAFCVFEIYASCFRLLSKIHSFRWLFPASWRRAGCYNVCNQSWNCPVSFSIQS